MKLSHENQSKNGRNCSEVALGGALDGKGTVVGMLPLITTGGMVGKGGGAVDVVVEDVVAVAVVSVVDVSGAGPLQPRSSAVSANEEMSMRVIDMIDSFRALGGNGSTLGVSSESESLPLIAASPRCRLSALRALSVIGYRWAFASRFQLPTREAQRTDNAR